MNLRALTITASALALCGCAALAPATLPIGTPISEIRASLVPPTGEYPLAGGGTRLEFSQGPFGKETNMLDFDAGGRLVAKTQVLTEANLGRIAPGLAQADLRMQYGRPAHVFSVPRQKLHVWNYRFADADCVWFQVSINNITQRVTEASRGADPACDGPSSRD